MDIILSGPINSGKSLLARQIANNLKLHKKDIKIGGIINSPVFLDERKIGYKCIDLLTNKDKEFAKRKDLVEFCSTRDIPIGQWIIYDEGIKFSEVAIKKAVEQIVDVIFIDEIGHLELMGNCLRSAFDYSLRSTAQKILIVRKSLIANVSMLFKNKSVIIFEIKEEHPDKNHNQMIIDKICNLCGGGKNILHLH